MSRISVKTFNYDFNYDKVDPSAYLEENYKISTKYSWLKILIVGEEGYVLLGNTSYKTEA